MTSHSKETLLAASISVLTPDRHPLCGMAELSSAVHRQPIVHGLPTPANEPVPSVQEAARIARLIQQAHSKK